MSTSGQGLYPSCAAVVIGVSLTSLALLPSPPTLNHPESNWCPAFLVRDQIALGLQSSELSSEAFDFDIFPTQIHSSCLSRSAFRYLVEDSTIISLVFFHFMVATIAFDILTHGLAVFLRHRWPGQWPSFHLQQHRRDLHVQRREVLGGLYRMRSGGFKLDLFSFPHVPLLILSFTP